MKNMVVVTGMAINFVLLAGIIYLNYFSPKPDLQRLLEQERKPSKSGTRKIAVIVPLGADKGMQENIQGLEEALAQEAHFTPVIKVYDANNNRVLMQSNIEAAIQDGADILVPFGSQAAQMTKEITEKRERLIPTVFAATADPVRLELIKDPDCSGNHLTGVSIVGLDWIDQMARLVPIVMPWVKRVFIPYDPTGLGGALEDYKEHLEKVLVARDIEVCSVKIYEQGDVASKMKPFLSETDLVIVLPGGAVVSSIDAVTKMTQEHKVPVLMAQNMSQLAHGATFAFGYHAFDIGAGAARHVCRIVERGQQPTEIPINRLESTYRIGINVENAEKIGILDKIDSGILFLMENGEVVGQADH